MFPKPLPEIFTIINKKSFGMVSFGFVLVSLIVVMGEYFLYAFWLCVSFANCQFISLGKSF